MAEAITEAGVPHGKGLGLWGKVPRGDAIRITRRWLEDEKARIQAALDTPDRDWAVTWRRGMETLPEPFTPDKRGQQEISSYEAEVAA